MIIFRLTKMYRKGQMCNKAGTREDVNDHWWPPAARPRPSVSDWWAKLDLLPEQQWGMGLGDRKHPLNVMAVSGAGDIRNIACHSHIHRGSSSGMPDMSPCARETSQLRKWDAISLDRKRLCLWSQLCSVAEQTVPMFYCGFCFLDLTQDSA